MGKKEKNKKKGKGAEKTIEKTQKKLKSKVLKATGEDDIESIVKAIEESSNDIFPNDGAPIVQGNVIRTSFGNAPLPASNVLDPNVRAELKELSDALKKVVSGDRLDPQALNTVLELSRDMQLSYN